MVTPALATLASHLLAVASNGGEPASIAEALTALHSLVFFDLLPPGDRPRVIALAHARLTDTQTPAVWLAAVELAVATGDERLRAMVAAIGTGAMQPRLSAEIDLDLFVRSAARRALDHARDWSRVAVTPLASRADSDEMPFTEA